VSGKQLAGLLCDNDRRRVFSAVALGAVTVEDVERISGLAAPAVAVALRRLVSADLVVEDAGRLAVNGDYLSAAARQPDRADPAAAPDRTDGPDFADRFIRGRRIRALPAQNARRQVILAMICSSTFEVARTYSEAEVNEALQEWCQDGGSDHVTLRRYLIDAGLMTRQDGRYRRVAHDSPAPAPA
jgi:hypothetical protein